MILFMWVNVPSSAYASGLGGELEKVKGDALVRLGASYSLPQQLAGIPVDVEIYPKGSQELRSAWPGLPAYAAGAADPAMGRIVLVEGATGRYPFGDLQQTLRHELSHVVLYRALGFQPPRWFDEGLAMRAGAEWCLPDEGYLALALYRVSTGSLTLSDIESDFREGESEVRRSYALARAFVADLFRSDADVAEFVLRARAMGSVDTAFVGRFGITPGEAFKRWAKDLPWWGEWLIFIGSPALLWSLIALLFFAAVVASVRRRRRVYEQLPD